jgi:ribosomal protein S19
MQSVLALRRYAFRNFAYTDFYNEAHTLRLARHPKSSEQDRTRANEKKRKNKVMARKMTIFPFFTGHISVFFFIFFSFLWHM